MWRKSNRKGGDKAGNYARKTPVFPKLTLFVEALVRSTDWAVDLPWKPHLRPFHRQRVKHAVTAGGRCADT